MIWEAGTFDVSVIEIGDGLIEVLSTSGDNHLGGDDFDVGLTDYLLAEFKASDHIDLSHDEAAVQRVREEAGESEDRTFFIHSHNSESSVFDGSKGYSASYGDQYNTGEV